MCREADGAQGVGNARAIDPPQPGDERQHLAGRRVTEGGLLRYVREQRARRQRLADDVVAVDQGASLERYETEQAAQDAGLSRPVGSDERDRLAAGDPERDALEDPALIEREAEIGDDDHASQPFAMAAPAPARASMPPPAAAKPTPAV